MITDVEERSWHKDGKLHDFDTRTPRVNRMLELLYEVKPVASITEDMLSDIEESDLFERSVDRSWWVRKVQ